MKKTTDNLNDLLRRFADAAAADDMAEEIRRGDELLERYPAHALSSRGEVRVLRHLRAAYPKRRWRVPFVGWMSAAAAVIAVIIILFGGSDIVPSVQPEHKPSGQPLAQVETPASLPAPAAAMRDLPGYFANLWDEAAHADSDESFISLKAELDTIAAMIEAVRFKKRDFPEERFINADDAELRDSQIITADFWKG
jgi:hypothetical protein